MNRLHLVAHTHWDREWYLTFEQFRLKLVGLVDRLLEMMKSDPDFKYFMLDGQTVVLEDYLDVRPEKASELRKLVQEGRIIIGPWHILPDEFLVSPEATVRNLLLGKREAAQFGPRMAVGYIPDPFGHIGQMPQILRGFGIKTASLQRGLSDEPSEFIWQSPDGSSVFMLYEREGYGNAAHLPMEVPDAAYQETQRLAAVLKEHSQSDDLLLLYGTDHQYPDPRTPATLAWMNAHLDGQQISLTTLPETIAAVQADLERRGIQVPTLSGELRSSKRYHLLPGVLSTRIWIKQRNHACENLLERWCEPFSTLAGLALANTPAASLPYMPGFPRLEHPEAAVRLAWKELMTCHPHDSICGCSIDQVHKEMETRFDRVEQIGEELTAQSLTAIASLSATDAPAGSIGPAIIVFNPTNHPRRDRVRCLLQKMDLDDAFDLVDAAGQPAPYRILAKIPGTEIAHFSMNRVELQAFITSFGGNAFGDLNFEQATYQKQGDVYLIEVWFKNGGRPNMAAWNELTQGFSQVVSSDPVDQFVIRARVLDALQLEFIAQDVPPVGYKTYWIKPSPGSASPEAVQDDRPEIENEYFRLTLDPDTGALTILDKLTKTSYPGLNRFVDGGDAGDEYNYCPPPHDLLVGGQVRQVRRRSSGGFTELLVELTLPIPESLNEDRQARSEQRVDLNISTWVNMLPGIPRIDIHTEVDNPARDHRLQVHFPVPFSPQFAEQDGHFEVIRRPVDLPEWDASWIEAPVAEKPQRAFTDLSSDQAGLMVANRGLPEISLRHLDGNRAEMALTLLRCVGWLSRDDFACRRGAAGPNVPTPGAQLLGRWGFDYAIIPHADGWQAASLQAEDFDNPLRAVLEEPHPGVLPPQVSLVSVEPAAFRLTAIKTTEDGQGWLVRGFNPASSELDVTVRPNFPYQQAHLARLDETPLETLPKDPGGGVTAQVGRAKLLTVVFDDGKELI